MLVDLSAPQWLFRRKEAAGGVVDTGLAYFPDIGRALRELAHRARGEDWGRPDFGVLYNYLDYTAHQLVREGKIVESVDDRGQPVAAFNTGLLTADTQPIYGFLSQNHNSLPEMQPWFFGRWALPSDVVMRHFARLPDRARYWKQSPAELLLNPDLLPIEPRLEHILEHKADRFPHLLQGLPHLRKHALKGAIDDAQRQIEADPHLAVPAYYVERESVSLLVPLRLVHAAIVDLALVVGPFGDSRYAAWTVYPLEWAYRSARLIKAPSAGWLSGPPSAAQEQPCAPAN